MIKLLAFCVVAASVWGATQSPGTDIPAGDFWRQPALDERINSAEFNRELMARAIFHETNRVREKLGLRPFEAFPKLDDAADLEAALGKVSQPPSHTNPFPMIGTPLQRVQYVGLKPRAVAENIALLTIYDIDPNIGVGSTVRDGRRQWVNSGTLAELKPATYRGFAAAVVEAWMESPDHRANLVNPALRYLGCSVQPTTSLMGVAGLFCVQVFFTPANRR